MKGLSDFFSHINTDSELKETFANSTDFDEVCSKAKKYGYKFTKNELQEAYLKNISGGSLYSSTSTSGSYNTTKSFDQSIHGDGNVQITNGGINFDPGATPTGENHYSGIDANTLAALSIIFGNK